MCYVCTDVVPHGLNGFYFHLEETYFQIKTTCIHGLTVHAVLQQSNFLAISRSIIPAHNHMDCTDSSHWI